jgi:hypothetical protein
LAGYDNGARRRLINGPQACGYFDILPRSSFKPAQHDP